MKKSILFISGAPGDALRAARRLNLHVVMLTDSLRPFQADLVDDVLPANPFDVEAAVQSALRWASETAAGGVVTFEEFAVPCASAVAQALGVTGNSPAAAYAARNKYAMRRAFRDAGLGTPRFGVARSADEAVALARGSIGFPAVLKPLFGMASQGVLRVDDAGALRAGFDRVQRIAEEHRRFVGDDPDASYLLLEEYMTGAEVAVDGLIDGDRMLRLGIFDKPDIGAGPTFEDSLYVGPTTQPPGVCEHIWTTVERGCRALGLTTGPVHAELRLTAGGPRLLEIGARAIGGVCIRAFEYCLGIDYSELILRHALGERLDHVVREGTPVGIMMVTSDVEGRLAGISGVEAARACPGIHGVLVSAEVGDTIRVFPEQSCYLGFVLGSGPSQAEVASNLRLARSCLQFAIEAPDEARRSEVASKR